MKLEDFTKGEKSMERKEIICIDGFCPKCGTFCGNDGYGPLKCECGWIGTDDPTDLLALCEEEFGENDIQ